MFLLSCVCSNVEGQQIFRKNEYYYGLNPINLVNLGPDSCGFSELMKLRVKKWPNNTV